MLNKFFESTSGFMRMASLQISQFIFSVAIGNIYAHFAPVNRGLNWAYFVLKTR